MIEGKRIAVLAEEDFEDVELCEPVKVLREAGAQVTIVGGESGKTYHGKKGRESVRAEVSADEIDIADFDAIVIPGGYAPDKMRLHRSMVDLVRRANDSGKLIAAICHGPQLLISAGIVRGRQMTSWPSVAVDLQNAGANWVDRSVVQDGNLITSRKPADIPEFNKAVIKALELVGSRAG